ncbi:MAG: hypothetical protein J7K40_02090 [candidate division Zixibacteria bacterium]|nr:hypothetical protein [candidate division Zixibacteria bacterium]
MSFTTVEIVKKHIIENRISVGQVYSEPVKLIAGTPAKLKYPPVQSASEKVKAKEQNKPDYEAIIFPVSDKAALDKSDLLRDSVVVASDSSLGQIYRENLDYTVDYNKGALIRISSGDIAPEAVVSVWYMPYRVYERGADFSIDYANGEITRLSSGDIEACQLVYIDYISEYSELDEQTINNAINEANEQILNYIDSAFASSSDKSLVIAETYLAVSIICRIKALQTLSSMTNKSSCASWSVLTDQYKHDAYLLLEKFTGSMGGLKAPSKA